MDTGVKTASRCSKPRGAVYTFGSGHLLEAGTCYTTNVGYATTLSNATRPKVEELEDEFSENEFEDAEVETSMSQQTVNSCSVIAGISTVTSEPIPAATEPEQTDDTTECEDDMEILDVSDLDDQEPETKDIVIGIIDKISRPSTKKTTAPTWKVKLKYGILQINGVEIPFDNLEGEFEF
uniref:DNA-directed RNA polymerase II large subunit, putative n=1 Tax=Babesia bovis TaxID=5865 RepID=A7AVV9_BABBO|eukprot:XP_001609503.1 DNA-directed RNA polymerase II large subunit [Babesia bovis T2Bo]